MDNAVADRVIKKKYRAYFERRLVLSALAAAAMHFAYYLARTYLSRPALGAIPVLYLVICWVPAQFIFLSYAYCRDMRTGVFLSCGEIYRPLFGALCRAALYICASTPTVIGIMIFKFNEETRAFDNFNFWKVQFIIAPAVIILMFAVGWFWGAKSPATHLSKADLYDLRIDLELAGYDVNGKNRKK